jgi:hypothetical protein
LQKKELNKAYIGFSGIKKLNENPEENNNRKMIATGR